MQSRERAQLNAAIPDLIQYLSHFENHGLTDLTKYHPLWKDVLSFYKIMNLSPLNAEQRREKYSGIYDLHTYFNRFLKINLVESEWNLRNTMKNR